MGGALEAFWRHFKSPGNDESDGKTEDSKQYYKPNDPIRNFEEWKNLSGDLDQEPGDNPVSNCDPVNVSAASARQESFANSSQEICCGRDARHD